MDFAPSRFSPLVNRFPLNPYFPPLESTREAADSRGLDSIWIRCSSCQHRVGFRTFAEKARFVSSSGWRQMDATGDILICPCCDRPATERRAA